MAAVWATFVATSDTHAHEIFDIKQSKRLCWTDVNMSVYLQCEIGKSERNRFFDMLLLFLSSKSFCPTSKAYFQGWPCP